MLLPAYQTHLCYSDLTFDENTPYYSPLQSAQVPTNLECGESIPELLTTIGAVAPTMTPIISQPPSIGDDIGSSDASSPDISPVVVDALIDISTSALDNPPLPQGEIPPTQTLPQSPPHIPQITSPRFDKYFRRVPSSSSKPVPISDPGPALAALPSTSP